MRIKSIKFHFYKKQVIIRHIDQIIRIKRLGKKKVVYFLRLTQKIIDEIVIGTKTLKQNFKRLINTTKNS